MTRAEKKQKAREKYENLVKELKENGHDKAMSSLVKLMKTKPQEAELYRKVAREVLPKSMLKRFEVTINGKENKDEKPKEKPDLTNTTLYQDNVRFEKITKPHIKIME